MTPVNNSITVLLLVKAVIPSEVYFLLQLQRGFVEKIVDLLKSSAEIETIIQVINISTSQ